MWKNVSRCFDEIWMMRRPYFISILSKFYQFPLVQGSNSIKATTMHTIFPYCIFNPFHTKRLKVAHIQRHLWSKTISVQKSRLTCSKQITITTTRCKVDIIPSGNWTTRKYIPWRNISCWAQKCLFTLWPKQNGRHFPDAIHAFYWMKMFKFRLRFHWNLFPRVQLTIS